MDPRALELYMQALERGDTELAQVYLDTARAAAGDALQATQAPPAAARRPFVEVEREGVRFSVPADATEEQIQAFLRLREAPAMREAPLTPAEPLPSPTAQQAARERAVQESVSEQMAGRAAFLTPEERDIEEAAAQRRAELATEPLQAIEGADPIRTGDDLLPPFRPTRIRRLQVYREVPAEQAAQMTPQQVAAEETRPPLEGEPTAPIDVRAYYEAPDGTLTKPTTYQRFVESFAQQPVLSESAARQLQDQQTESLQAALRGEARPPFSATVLGAATQALLETREEGRGIVETPLQATIRGTAGIGSAAAAEVIGGAAEAVGLGTRRSTAEPTLLDPEMRRRASDAPTFIDRTLENAASGRGLGDELADIDAVRDTIGEVPAFFIGTGGDMLTPGYLGMVSKAGRVAAGTRAGRATSAQLANQARKRVADRIISKSNLTPEEIAAARRAAAQTDGTEGALVEAVRGAVPGDEAADIAADFAADLRRYTPADLEMVTDTVAVPRRVAPQVREAAQRELRAATSGIRDDRALAADLLAVATADDAVAAARAEQLAARIDVGVPPARIRAAQPQTVRALRVAAARLEDAQSPSQVAGARNAARGAVRQLERDTGLAPGTYSSRIGQPGSPRALIDPSLSPDVRAALNVDRWSDVNPVLRERVFEQLRAGAARRAAQGLDVVPRSASEVTTFQTGVRSMTDLGRALQRVNDGQWMRWARTLAGEEAPSVAVVRAVEQRRGAAENVMRKLTRDLTREAQDTLSVDKAIDRLVVSTGASRRQDPEIWLQLAESMYGPRVRARLDPLRATDEALPLARLVQSSPSVEGLMELDRRVRAMRIFPKVPMTRAVARQTLINLLVKRRTEQVPALARVADALRVGDVGADAAEAAARTSRFRAVPGEITDLPSVRVSSGEAPLSLRRDYDPFASESERFLSRDFMEGLQYLESVQPAQRSSISAVARSNAEYIYDQARNARNAMRYGVVLPNLPVQLGRLFSIPVISAANIGVADTIRALGRTGQRVGDHVLQTMGRRRAGGNIETPEGFVYSPADVLRLSDDFGIGYSTLDTERLGSLSRDLARAAAVEADLARPGALGVASKAARTFEDIGNPFVRSMYMRVAEAIEMSHRYSVFETALAAGRSPSEAADLARRSLFDYGAQPEFVRSAGRYLTSAQRYYGILSGIGAYAARNPYTYGALLRGLQARKDFRDPYHLEGDKALTRLGLTVAGEDNPAVFYGPDVLILAPVEQAVAVARFGNLLYRDLQEAAAAPTAAEAADDVAGVFYENGAALVAATVAEQLPFLTEIIERQSRAALTDDELEGVDDEQRLFWQAATVARHLDPEGAQGVWAQFRRIAQPRIVEPPEDAAHPLLPHVWTRQPPGGVPHMLYAREESGAPLYLVMEPTEQGLQNLALLRAATPQQLEEVFGAYGAMVADSPRGIRLPAESIDPTRPPEQVFGDFPTGPGAAAAMLLGTEGAPADIEQRRRQQIEQLRTTMEAPQ